MQDQELNSTLKTNFSLQIAHILFFCESVGFFRAAWDCGCKRKEINMWVLCRKCLFHCLSDKSGFDASDGLMLRSIYPLSQVPHLAIHSHSDPEASGYYLPRCL